MPECWWGFVVALRWVSMYECTSLGEAQPARTRGFQINRMMMMMMMFDKDAAVDGVGRVGCQSFSPLRSINLWIILAVIASRCTYYQSQRFKHRFRVLVCKRQKMSLRLLLIKKKLTKLCTVKTVYCNLKASHKVSKSPRNNRLVQRHAMACKGKYRAKLWLCVQSRNIYSCTLGYLFLLLILCGDVHPNPGPVLPLHRRHPQAESLVVGAWNVRTLLGTTRSHVRPTAIVSRELSRYNIDVAALSETRILGETRIDEVGGGYTFFLKGKDLGERHYHGVGLAVRTSLLPLLNGKYPHGVNERLMTVNLHLDGCTLTLISAYAPTLCSSDEDKEVFYKKLNEIIKEAPVANKLLLLGDFNARVGTDYESRDGVLGHHGVGNENTNGTMLLSLCTRHQLTITNTLFNQEEQFITTWMHPGSKRWHLIDYVITRNRDIHDVLHTRAMCGPCAWSDHKLVKCKLALKIKKPVHHSKSKTATKLNVAKLRSKEVNKQLAKWLHDAQTETTGDGDVETAWSKHKDLTLR